MLYEINDRNVLTITASIPELWKFQIAHLARQGTQCSFKGSCMYDFGGKQCVVGAINPTWFSRKEGHALRELVREGKVIMSEEVRQYMLKMQHAHDYSQSIIDLYYMLKQIAHEFNLPQEDIKQITRWYMGEAQLTYKLTLRMMEDVKFMPSEVDAVRKNFGSYVDLTMENARVLGRLDVDLGCSLMHYMPEQPYKEARERMMNLREHRLNDLYLKKDMMGWSEGEFVTHRNDLFTRYTVIMNEDFITALYSVSK